MFDRSIPKNIRFRFILSTIFDLCLPLSIAFFPKDFIRCDKNKYKSVIDHNAIAFLLFPIKKKELFAKQLCDIYTSKFSI